MKNRCCLDCSIYNWDMLMAVTPLFFVRSFFSISLIVPAAALFLWWEISYRLHPQWFLTGLNRALSCDACTDRMCRSQIFPIRRANAKR
jgi:hypothetical protein